MGVQAQEALDIQDLDTLVDYLRAQTRVFMEVDGKTYYVTHTDSYWRAQDCAALNEKGHFSDCSELVPTLSEMVGLVWNNGMSIKSAFEGAKFFASIQE